MQVTELTEGTWSEAINGVQNLAVVEFYAPWCRTCRVVTPKYEQLAKKLEAADVKADFFKVNFKANKDLCYAERVFALPTFHFYVPEIGRVNRFTATAGQLNGRLTTQLARFVDPPEEDGQSTLARLQAVRRAAVEPVVMYKDMMGMLEGLASPQSETSLDRKSRVAQALASPARLERLESLFTQLDRDGNGVLDLGELAEAMAALSSVSAEQGGTQKASMDQLLERIANDAGGADAVAIDKATFVGSVTNQEVAQFGSPAAEFLSAFEGMDKDGDGTISKEELVGTVGRFCSLMSAWEDDADEEAELAAQLAEAFDAFDTDQSGELDYEEFVMMVSSRAPDQLAATPTAPTATAAAKPVAGGVQSWYDNGFRL